VTGSKYLDCRGRLGAWDLTGWYAVLLCAGPCTCSLLFVAQNAEKQAIMKSPLGDVLNNFRDMYDVTFRPPFWVR